VGGDDFYQWRAKERTGISPIQSKREFSEEGKLSKRGGSTGGSEYLGGLTSSEPLKKKSEGEGGDNASNTAPERKGQTYLLRTLSDKGSGPLEG